MKQLDMFPVRKQPIEKHKDEVVFWKCLKDCWMKGNTIRSFTEGKTYLQIRSKYLALVDDNQAHHQLSEWDIYFVFDRKEPINKRHLM